MRVLTQRDSDLDIAGITAAQFLAGGVPLIPLVLLAGGTTDWSRPSLIAQLAYLIIGGQLLVYVGFNAALSRWPSTRVYAWTFLVPVVAVLVEAVRGSLPGTSAMVGIALVILGVAIVNHSPGRAVTGGRRTTGIVLRRRDQHRRPRTCPRRVSAKRLAKRPGSAMMRGWKIERARTSATGG